MYDVLGQKQLILHWFLVSFELSINRADLKWLPTFISLGDEINDKSVQSIYLSSGFHYLFTLWNGMYILNTVRRKKGVVLYHE